MANSAREPNSRQQHEISKKLVLSGFFEDDFSGDVLKEEPSRSPE